MKSQVILLFISLTLAVGLVSTLRHSQWTAYKRRFGKTYAGEEDEVRKAILTEAHRKVLEHNAKNRGFTMALNHLSDWTSEEQAKLNGLIMSKHRLMNTLEAQKFVDDILNDDSPVPESVDWRKVPGRVSKVKNQGYCSSCWAFATTGVLEGQEAVRGNYSLVKNLVELSEQNLVDCSGSNHGCNGGFMLDAMTDIKKEGGIEREIDYPYESEDSSCRFLKQKSVMSDKGGAILPEGDEEALKKVVARFGPVSVGMDARDDLRNYKSGVYYDEKCSPKELNHGVLVVGYGTDPKGGDYWLIKNSWSTQWGENGYLRISRKDNHCGIATVATIPIF